MNQDNALNYVNNYRNSNRDNKKILIIVCAVIVLLFGVFFFYQIKSHAPKTKEIEDSSIVLIEQNIRLKVQKDFNEFSVIIESLLEYENATSATFHIPKTEYMGELYDVTMSGDGLETSRWEDDDNYYFVFSGEEGKVNGFKTNIIRFKYYPYLLDDTTKFIFIDSLTDNSDTKYNLSVVYPLDFFKKVEANFNKILNCNYADNEYSCFVDEVKKDEPIYITFKIKDVE